MHHFDLVVARRADGSPPRFLSMLEREARIRGMVFFHCQNHEHAETLRWALYRSELKIDCLIDYMGRSFRLDYELGCAVKDAGGLVLDDPDRVKIYGDKAVMHQELARMGIAMPRTLLWQPGQPSRDLTREERAYLGLRIVCKPANGSGSGGVTLDLLPTRAGRRTFLPIDYLNNKCFMLTHSEFGPAACPTRWPRPWPALSLSRPVSTPGASTTSRNRRRVGTQRDGRHLFLLSIAILREL